MIIVAGALQVRAEDRDRYLAAVQDSTAQARRAPGCLDFTQAADPLDPERINVYERWTDDDSLLAFRASGGGQPGLPDLLGADVAKYRIASVEDP